MDNCTSKHSSRRIQYNQFNRKKMFTILIFIIISISLPGNVKCDMGDTISSFILFIIFSVFVCAGIGWWSRRAEGNNNK